MGRQATPDIIGDVLTAEPWQLIRLREIKTDGGTQMRAKLDEATVAEYSSAIVDSGKGIDVFPPIVVYYDGMVYWLADGFHRVAAFREHLTDGTMVRAEVRAGSRRDAVLFAAGANASHGLRREPADKRRSVDTLLRDEEWSQWSDREIARRCNVHHQLVASIRASLDDHPVSERTYTTKHGTTATMQTANIGSGRSSKDRQFYGEQPAAPAPIRTLMEVFVTPEEQEIAAGEAAADEAVRQAAARPLTPAAPIPLAIKPAERPLPTWATDEPADEPVLLLAPNRTAVVDVMPVSQREDYDSDEWYTPAWVIDAARQVMGGFDLDPASCAMAQAVVQAAQFWTREQDGLEQRWYGRVWLNPPYSAPKAFIEKLVTEYGRGNVNEAIALVNNSTETEWFQMLLCRNFPVCFLNRRLAFWRHDHADVGARQGQAIFYFGPRTTMFYQTFGRFGPVLRSIS